MSLIHENIATQTDRFPAMHKQFYEEFAHWCFSKRKTSNCKTGVYILHAGKSICRLLKTDSEGILYIGQGSVLSTQSRLGKLINAINATEARHSVGLRLHKVFELYPLGDMYVRVILCEDSRLTESKYIEQYIEEFGELPPLNRQI